jgi:hypothetical protein
MSGADMFGFQKTLDWTERFQPYQRETNKWSRCKLLKWFARLGWLQLAFPRDPLVLLLGTLDAIFPLTVAVGENLGHDADTTRYILKSGLLGYNSVPDFEFCRHRLLFPAKPSMDLRLRVLRVYIERYTALAL